MTMGMFRTLRPDERGIAAVEFAMIAPVMIMMICGFMEYAHVSTARTTLEAATMRAARAVAASDCPSEREALMLAIVEEAMDSTPAKPGTQLEIVTKAYSSFTDVEGEPFVDRNNNGRYDIDPAETDPARIDSFTDINGNGVYDRELGTVGSIGGAGQVVTYTATFQLVSLFGFVSNRFNDGEGYALRASTVIRNEPIFRNTGCA